MTWGFPMSRKSRVFFVLVEVGFLSSILPGSVVAQLSNGQSGGINQRNRAVALTRSQVLADLKTIEPAQGHTQVDLSVQFGENTLNGMRIRHRSYDGALVGPIIRVRPGDTLEVHLANKRPREVGPSAHGSAPGDFNTTNFHTHGLHISPNGESDNGVLRPDGQVKASGSHAGSRRTRLKPPPKLEFQDSTFSGGVCDWGRGRARTTARRVPNALTMYHTGHSVT